MQNTAYSDDRENNNLFETDTLLDPRSSLTVCLEGYFIIFVRNCSL